MGGTRNREQRVAVGRGVLYRHRGDRAAADRAILDHDLLAGVLRHGVGIDTGRDVGDAAGRDADDDGDRPRRKVLRLGSGGKPRHANGDRGLKQPCKTDPSHDVPPLPV